MKRLDSIVNGIVELELMECDCGGHLGIDTTYLLQDGDIVFPCPYCGIEIDTAKVFPEHIMAIKWVGKISEKKEKEEYKLLSTIAEFDMKPYGDSVLVVRKSDGRWWEFDNESEAGVYMSILYNKVNGDETRIIDPEPNSRGNKSENPLENA